MLGVKRVVDEEAQAQPVRRQLPGQQPAAPVRPAVAVDLVFVFVVIDAGHGTVRERQCDNGAGAGEAASLSPPALNARWHACCDRFGRWRSEERRVGTEGVSTCRSRWWP